MVGFLVSMRSVNFCCWTSVRDGMEVCWLGAVGVVREGKCLGVKILARVVDFRQEIGDGKMEWQKQS